MRTREWLLGVAVLCWPVALDADTLVMRDGRRVQGELVAVRDGMVEFDVARGSRGPDRVRIARRDVTRIDLDSDAYSADRGGGDGDRDYDRDLRRPSGLRERDVTADSWVPWKDTGIDVRAGDTVYFSATGKVRWGPKRQDGPKGEDDSPYNAARPIPNRPAAGLIGRVGEGRDYFFIGDEKGPIRMRSGGRLFLGINDDYLQDNGGSFRVTVAY